MQINRSISRGISYTSCTFALLKRWLSLVQIGKLAHHTDHYTLTRIWFWQAKFWSRPCWKMRDKKSHGACHILKNDKPEFFCFKFIDRALLLARLYNDTIVLDKISLWNFSNHMIVKQGWIYVLISQEYPRFYKSICCKNWLMIQCRVHVLRTCYCQVHIPVV